MIVRILGEGQLHVPDDQLGALNSLDAPVEAAVEAGDEPAFGEALAALLHGVRQVGTPVPDGEIVSSGLILPHAEATLAEVRDLLSNDGLIPG